MFSCPEPADVGPEWRKAETVIEEEFTEILEISFVALQKNAMMVVGNTRVLRISTYVDDLKRTQVLN